MCTLIEQSSSGWYLASPDLAVESPKYLLQIERGGVDFFKTKPPAGRGGARFLQHVAPDRPFYGHTARRNPPRKYLILQAENR